MHSQDSTHAISPALPVAAQECQVWLFNCHTW